MRAGPHGAKCEEAACPHDRLGRGICRSSFGRAWCECDAGWEGADCSVRGCPLRCSGRGKCVSTCETRECWLYSVNASLKCECAAGFCRPRLRERRACVPSDNCNGRGLCLDGVCHCKGGFQGPGCELRACPNDCSGRGTCGSDGMRVQPRLRRRRLFAARMPEWLQRPRAVPRLWQYHTHVQV